MLRAFFLLLCLLLLPQCVTDRRDEVLRLIPEIETLQEPWVLPKVDVRKLPRYGQGRCEHQGGSIYDFTLLYGDDDFPVALECSRVRCDGGDPVGCRDAAALLLDPTRGGPRQAVEGFTRARRGCDSGDGDSCAILAFEALQTEPAAVVRYGEKACLAGPDNLLLCSLVGRRLLEQGEMLRSIRLFLRSCRGTLSAPIEGRGIEYVRTDAVFVDPQAVGPELNRYEGCGELANLARANGDLAKAYDYDRLHCMHGAGGLLTCLQIAEVAIERRGVEDPETQAVLQQGCQVLVRTDRQEALCRNLRSREMPAVGSPPR